MWIDVEDGEMTLLVDEDKIKFDLHQSIPLTNEERRSCIKIEISFLPIEKQSPMFLQEDSLEGFELEANSFPTKELAFEFKLHNTEVEKLILVSNEDEKGVVATMDEGPKKRSRTSPMS